MFTSHIFTISKHYRKTLTKPLDHNKENVSRHRQVPEFEQILWSQKIHDVGLGRSWFEYMLDFGCPASSELNLDKIDMCAGTFQGHHVNPDENQFLFSNNEEVRPVISFIIWKLWISQTSISTKKNFWNCSQIDWSRELWRKGGSPQGLTQSGTPEVQYFAW